MGTPRACPHPKCQAALGEFLWTGLLFSPLEKAEDGAEGAGDAQDERRGCRSSQEGGCGAPRSCNPMQTPKSSRKVEKEAPAPLRDQEKIREKL